MKSYQALLILFIFCLSGVGQVAGQPNAQEADDPAIPVIEKDLITIFQSACDPNCCGQTRNDRTSILPCCKSCSNLVDFNKISNIPFALPREIRGLSILQDFVSETMFRVIAAGLNFVRNAACTCNDHFTTFNCCSPPWNYRPTNVECNKWVECSKEARTRSFLASQIPTLPPTLIEYEDGDFQFITQTEKRSLLTEKACYCEGEGFTTRCNDECIFNRRGFQQFHDEL